MSLADKTVVVTRGEKGSHEWLKSLTKLGATVYNLPTITMSPIELNETIVSALKSLSSFDWMIFTSANGVRYFLSLCKQLGLVNLVDTSPRVAVMGSRTATEVLRSGLKLAFEPTISDSKHLAAQLDPVDNRRILLLRTTIASDDLPTALEKRGADVSDLRIYKTAMMTGQDESFSQQLRADKVDFITFASPSAVDGFLVRVSKEDQALAKNIKVVAIGPSVVQALVSADFTNIHMAKTASIEGVIDTLQRLA